MNWARRETMYLSHAPTTSQPEETAFIFDHISFNYSEREVQLAITTVHMELVEKFRSQTSSSNFFSFSIHPTAPITPRPFALLAASRPGNTPSAHPCTKETHSPVVESRCAAHIALVETPILKESFLF